MPDCHLLWRENINSKKKKSVLHVQLTQTDAATGSEEKGLRGAEQNQDPKLTQRPKGHGTTLSKGRRNGVGHKGVSLKGTK